MAEKVLTTVRVGTAESAGTAEQLTVAINALIRPGTIALDNVPVQLNGQPIESASIVLNDATGEYFINLMSE